MKLLKKLVAWPLVAAALLLLPATATFARTSYEIITEANVAIEEFITFAQDNTINDDQYLQQYPLKAQALESKLDDIKDGLRTAINADSVGGVIDQVTAMQNALKNTRQALSDGDSEAFALAANSFDAALASYNAAIDSANKATTGFTEEEQTLLYWGLLGGSAMLAAGTFLWWRNNNTKSKLHPTHNPATETTLANMRRGIFLNSLWPVGGAAITLATYIYSTDGSYFILWGPMAIGFGFYVYSIFNYVKVVRALRGTTTPRTQQPSGTGQ